MDSIDQTSSIIKTKIFRPPVTTDLVRREELLARLEQGLNHRLTLVSAPAGYGKSTLVSSWLEESALPSAWLSLGKSDNDIYQFLNYFIASIRTLFPNACSKSLSFLQGDNKPTNTVLSAQLINDLDAITEPFIIALDDYHEIQSSIIHEMINEIFKFPGRTVHLAIITRRNPPFPLGALRARDLITEIRMQELEFTAAESELFMNKACSVDLDESVLQRLHNEIEGWPAGLRLAALALKRKKDPQGFLRGFTLGNRDVQDYLVAEVMDTLSPMIRDWLLKTSILNRFCAPLCEALCQSEKAETGQESINGHQFLRILEDTGLFGIALDDGHEWFRYHHLFQTLQKTRLIESVSRSEISQLHQKAAIWFEMQGMFDEAIYHYLETNNPDKVGNMLSRHRLQLTKEERWVDINRWLGLIPNRIIESNTDLLILHARSLDKKGEYGDWAKTLIRIETMLGDCEPVTPEQRLHHGELILMQGTLFYHNGQGKAGADYTERALQLLPPEAVSERVLAIMMHAVSLQMIGNLKGAYEITYDALQHEAKSGPTSHGRLLQTLCFLNWMSANLPEMERAAAAMLDIGLSNSLPETTVFSRYFLGASHYHNNLLDEAIGFLSPVAENPYGPSFFMHVMSVQALSLIHEIQGRPDQARALSDQLSENILEMGGGSYLPHAQALQAELAFRQGRQSEAIRWAKEFAFGETTAGYTFIIPGLIAVKLLLADESANSLSLANKVLLADQQFFSSTHNPHFLAEVLALQAILYEMRGEQEEAAKKITEALTLTQPGGDIRLYVDLGHQLVPLLNRVNLDQEGLRYTGRILAVLRDESSSALGSKLNNKTHFTKLESSITPLTNREQEILQFLTDNLTNKEIGEKLFISPKTVKRHAESIYSKLGVHRRQEAIAKAIGLGVIEVASSD